MLADIPDDGIIRIPYVPRPQFAPFHNRTQRWGCLVCHRRAGKTVACIHELQRSALKSRHDSSLFAYIAPTFTQAKTVAWEYLTRAAAPILRFGAKANISELRMDYPNGSKVRLFGADRYNALRGVRLDGAVLDEFADFDPRAWDEVIRPALSDRKGFAVFIGTPKGHNAFYKTWLKAQGKPDWYTLMLKASQSVPINDELAEKYGQEWAEDNSLLTSDELLKLREESPEETYQQEFECSFEAAIRGAVYGKYMAEAEASGRIRSVPFDPASQVYTAWDIGGDHDATAIWFCQVSHNTINIIDHYEAVGSDSAPHVRAVLNKPYSYTMHFLPHDAGPKRPGVDKGYTDFLEDHGLKNLTVLPRESIEIGINAARLALPRCYFDEVKCRHGIECMKMYQFEFDEKSKSMKSSPKHDWSSHTADSFRYLCIGLANHRGVSSSFRRKIIYPKSGVA